MVSGIGLAVQVMREPLERAGFRKRSPRYSQPNWRTASLAGWGSTAQPVIGSQDRLG